MIRVLYGPWERRDDVFHEEYRRRVIGSPTVIIDGEEFRIGNCLIWWDDKDKKYRWATEPYEGCVFASEDLEECKRMHDLSIENKEYRKYWGKDYLIEFVDRETFDKLSLLM